MGVPAEVLSRLGDPKALEGLSPADLQAVIKEYYEKWVASENEKYDIEYSVKLRDMQIQELEMEVSDMRGKFIIPKLKKVHTFKLMGGEE
jgi:troponin I